jgi:hypothetical protein
MNTDPQTIEDNYASFWKEIVENPDGSINIEQVKKELFDYSMMLDAVPKVYDYVTGGHCSKPHTKPEAVMSLHDEAVTRLCDEAVAEDREMRDK